MNNILIDAVIGGADGPTSVILSGSPVPFAIIGVAAVLIIAAVIILVRHKKKKK